jgi:large subunit ribosomal protein L24
MKGKDRGRSGNVRKVIPEDKKVIISGINIVKRHMRPRGPQQPGGIIEREAPISWANVALLCQACNKPARVGYRVLADGRKVRYCKRCDANFD